MSGLNLTKTQIINIGLGILLGVILFLAPLQVVNSISQLGWVKLTDVSLQNLPLNIQGSMGIMLIISLLSTAILLFTNSRLAITTLTS